MKIITNVQFYETEKETSEIISYNPENLYDFDTDINFKIKREIIRGTTFFNNKNEKIVLGATNNVQEILGLPFHFFQTSYNTIKQLETTIANINSKHEKIAEELKTTISKHEETITKIKNSNFITRIKFLLTKKL